MCYFQYPMTEWSDRNCIHGEDTATPRDAAQRIEKREKEINKFWEKPLEGLGKKANQQFKS